MIKYMAVSFKKDQIAALYFTMSNIVHVNINLSNENINTGVFRKIVLQK